MLKFRKKKDELVEHEPAIIGASFSKIVQKAVLQSTDGAVLYLFNRKSSSLKSWIVDASAKNSFIVDLTENICINSDHANYQDLHTTHFEHLHARLTAAGPFALVVIDSPKAHSLDVPLFRMLLHHVRPKGKLIVRNPVSEMEWLTVPKKESLPAHLGRLFSYFREQPPRKGYKGRDDHQLSRIISDFNVTSEATIISRSSDDRFLSKVREEYFNELLSSSKYSHIGSVITETTDAKVDTQYKFNTNRPDLSIRFKKKYTAPKCSLRAYNSAVFTPGQFVYSSDVVLPDSFRHNQYHRLTNRFSLCVHHNFAEPRVSDVGEFLSGSYFLLDSEWPTHFGHVITEQLSRLWCLKDLLAIDPDVRFIISTKDGSDRLKEWEYSLFSLAGIESSSITIINRPVIVEKLYAATPMFSQPNYVHTQLAPVYDEYRRAALTRNRCSQQHNKKIFISRRAQLARGCKNTDEVERYFHSKGFDIVFPEDHDIDEQLCLFSAADVVAGFAGSGLFHIAFFDDIKKVIVIASESYNATNEFLYSQLREHELSYIWCRAEFTSEKGGGSPKIFHSPFYVDFENDGDYIEAILSS